MELCRCRRLPLAIRSAALLSCLFSLGTSDLERSSVKAAPELCCFERGDISLELLGRPPGQPFLVIDNFFCEDALQSIVEVAGGNPRSFRDLGDIYPGQQAFVKRMVRRAKLRTGPIAQIASGEHMRCLQRAMAAAVDDAVADAAGGPSLSGEKAAMDRAAGVGSWLPLGLLGRMRSANHDEPGLRKLEKVAAEARALGLLEDQEASRWAMLDILSNASLRRHMRQEAHEAMLSFVARRPTEPMIHMDEQEVVVNVHLTAGHEDTGTSFWRPVGVAGGSDICLGSNESLLACQRHDDRHRIEEHKQGGPWLLHEVDPTGFYERFHVLGWRRNRAIVYNGRIAHTAFVPPEAQGRLLGNLSITTSRLMLQNFMESPLLVATELLHRLLKGQAAARSRSKRKKKKRRRKEL